MFKSTMIVTILGLIAKILAFLRDIFIANSFGATWATDAYNISITVTNVIYSVIGIVLTSSLIPLIGNIEAKEGQEGVNKLCSNIINIFIIIAVAGIILVFGFTGAITKVMAPLYTGEAKALTDSLIRISAISLIPMVLNSVFNAILQYKHDFLGANMSTLVINLSIIVMMVLVPDMSIKALIIITVIASFIQVIVQIPWLLKHKFKYRLTINYDKNIRFLFRVGVPLLLGTFASQFNNIIDKSIASTLPEGSISALSYAFKLESLPHVIFGYAIVTVAFPYIAKIYNQNKEELFDFVQNTNIYIAIIMVFSTAYLIFMRKEVVTVLFGYGNFDATAINNTAIALAGYCVGLSFLAIKDIYIRVFYTINDSKFVMNITVISVLINLVLSLSLVKFFGILALSLSSSIAAAISTFVSYRRVKKEIGIHSTKKVTGDMLKITIASIVAVLPMSLLNKYLIRVGLNNFISLVLISILAALIYFIIVYIIGVGDFKNQVDDYKRKIMGKIKGN